MKAKLRGAPWDELPGLEDQRLPDLARLTKFLLYCLRRVSIDSHDND